MSTTASAKASLYGLLVAEIARISAHNEPAQLTSEGKFVDQKQIDISKIGRKGSVFCHNFTSAFENGAFVLWALQLAEPVKAFGADWAVDRDRSPGSLKPYYQLQHDIDAMPAVAANAASRMFPSLDYVLSAYLDVIEQASDFFIELAVALKNDSELNSIAEVRETVREIVASTLPDGYDGKRANLPILIQAANPDLAVLLELGGYLNRKQGHLSWTEVAAPALQGNFYALQGGDVTTDDDGWPRLRPRN